MSEGSEESIPSLDKSVGLISAYWYKMCVLPQKSVKRILQICKMYFIKKSVYVYRDIDI